jgi:NADH dehydrogenase [ubiquinone] 1 alpha subcomplex assembly factor 5
MSPHLSPMTTPQDIGSLLNSSGFSMLTLDLDEILITYPTIFELLYDLKGMGENNCSWNRGPNLSKNTLLAAQSIYKEMYGNDDSSIPATFQVLYFIAWKPHEKHVQPAKRGSGEVSFKDVDKLNEIVDKKKEK